MAQFPYDQFPYDQFPYDQFPYGQFPPESESGRSPLILPPNLPLSDLSLLGSLPMHPAKPFIPSPLLTDEKYTNGCFLLGNQALRDGFWALARHCFITCLYHYQERPAFRYNLGLCELATGRYRMASVHLSTALRLAPGHPEIKQCLQHLSVIEQQQRTLGWYFPVSTAQRDLMLKPFHACYLPAVTGLLQNPLAAHRVNINRFSCDASEQDWWRQRLKNKQHRTLVSMHRDLGFVGTCHAQLLGEDSWCSFWLGHHLRHPTLGYDTVRLLCRMLQTGGVKRLYTAIYRENTTARRVLELSGFSYLPVTMEKSLPNLGFYGRGIDGGQSTAGQELLIEQLSKLLSSDNFV